MGKAKIYTIKLTVEELFEVVELLKSYLQDPNIDSDLKSAIMKMYNTEIDVEGVGKLVEVQPPTRQ